MEKIEIRHFDLEFERNVQTTECFVELHDTYFRYKAVYDSEVPNDQNDLLQGWKDMFYDFDMRLKRDSFVSVESLWNDKGNHWQIELEINGYPGTVNLYYKKEDKYSMMDVFDKIFKWAFKL